MFFKPKSTVKNPRALLYKRFTHIEEQQSQNWAYITLFGTENQKFWAFAPNNDNPSSASQFVQVERNFEKSTVVGENTIMRYVYKGNSYDFKYVVNRNSSGIITSEYWENIEVVDSPDSLIYIFDRYKLKTMSKYQINDYYFYAYFDYMIKGSISGTTTQYLKGNIMPLQSLNIKYFDDIKLREDDLVVIDGRLYSVESPETVLKMQPKPFPIYFATLNSIL